MRLLLSFFLILLLTINTAFSSPNGKGIICKCLKCSIGFEKKPMDEFEIAIYLFENNLVSNYEMYVHQDKMQFNEF